MSQTTLHQPSQSNLTAVLSPRVGSLLVAAIGLIAAGAVAAGTPFAVILGSAGLGLLALATVVGAAALKQKRAQAALIDAVSQFVENDASPSFTTDDEGVIGYQNAAATERFGENAGNTLATALNGLFASPGAVLHRLQNRAALKRAAREDVVLRRGHLRLSVHQIGAEGFLWRLEDIAGRSATARGADGISLPMLNVSKSDTVLFMNEAMRRLIGGRESTLDKIVNDMPIRPGSVHEIASISGPMHTIVHEIVGAAGRRELFFLPADSATPQTPDDWTFFDALPVPLLKLSRAGKVLMANRLARDLLSLPADADAELAQLVEGLGRPVADWLHDAVNGRRLHQAELVRASNTASELFLQISLSRVETGGEIVLVAVLNDATELKTLEAQFVQSQKMQAIGQLAGGVAHDFNNLLTAISGHCDLLLLRHDKGDPNYADLEQINQNANRAASLVGQLLAFSRKQNLQPQMLDLRDTLAELTHLLNRLVGERIMLTVSHDPALKMVRADKRQLEQVMMNLVVNARDAMPQGGAIEITTELEFLEEDLERDRAVVPAGEYVVVRVSDEGSGIPPDKLPKIFEPFFTTKRAGEGTGLGLSTAYGIIKQTGGFIFADSALGAGTTFTLYFQAQEQVEEPLVLQNPVEPRPSPPQGEGVILLVEDEAPVRAFASRALRMRGYTVLEAANGEEALTTLDDDTLAVDVFVTDVIMPGMDGPSWVSKALVERPDTRVVFVSGYAEENFAESQAKIPNSVFLPKPFSLNKLTETVQAQLH